jgi:integrase
MTDIQQAQSLLGHTSEKMTKKYVRHTSGKLVEPVVLRNIGAK